MNQETNNKIPEVRNDLQELASILDTLDELIYSISIGEDGSREVQYVSPKISELFGFTKTDYLEKTKSGEIFQFYHPDDVPEIKKASDRLKAEKSKVSLTYRFLPKGTDRYIWLEEKVYPQINAKGVHYGNIGMIRDVTENIISEKRLLKRERQFRKLFYQAPIGMVIYDRNGKINKVNQAFCESLDLPEKDLIGKKIKEFLNKKEENSLPGIDEASGDKEGEMEFLNKEGDVVPSIVKVTYDKDNEQEEEFFILQMMNISKRKESEEFLRKIIDTDPNLIFVKDLEGKFTRVNKAVSDIYGTKGKDLIGKTDHDLFPKEDADYFQMEDQQVLKTKKPLFLPNETIVNPDTGASRNFQIIKTLLNLSGKEEDQVLGVATDITEQKKLERLLNETNSMAKVGGWELDVSTMELFWTNEVYRILEFPPDQIPSLEISVSRFEEESRNKLWGAFEKTLEDGTSFDLELKTKKEKEQEKWIRAIGKAVREKGKIVKIRGAFHDITELMEAQRTVEISEHSYRDLFNNSNELIYIQDEEGKFLDVNRAVLNRYGVSKEEVIGDTPEIFSAPGMNDMEKVQEFVRKALEGEPQVFDWWGKTKKGEVFPKEVALRKGRYFGRDVIIASGRDITERVNAHQALQKSEARYRTLMENSLAGVYRTNLDRKILACNDAFARIFGFNSKEEVLGKRAEDLYGSSEDQEKYVELLENANGKLTDHENSITRLDGKRIYILENSQIIRNEEGEAESIEGNLIDITQRKETEKDLEESEEKFRLLFSEANDAIFIVDGDMFLDCNDKTLEIFGCKREEIIGKHPYEFSPQFQPDGRSSTEKVREKVEKALEGDPQSFYWKHTKKDGTLFDAEVNLNIFEFKGKNYIQAIVRDISERVEAETALKESEERFKRLSDSTQEGIVIHDKGTILEANKAFCEMTGYEEEEEVIGKHAVDFVTEEYRNIITDKIKDNSNEPYEVTGIKKGGEEFVAELRGGMIPYKDIEARVVAIRDITQKKKAEEDLRESEKRFRLLSEATIEGVILLDGEKLIDANEQAAKMLGYENREELIERNASEFLDVENMDEELAQIKSGGEELRELTNIRKDGSKIIVETKGKFIPYQGRQVRISVIHDVTHRKKIESQLRERERTISTLLGNLPGMAYRCRNDRNWTMEFVSNGARELTGYDPDDLIDNKTIAFGKLIVEEDQDRLWEEVQASISENRPFDIQYQIQTADGSIRNIWEKGEAVYDENGAISALEGFCTDITERVKYEKELEISRKRYQDLIEKSPYGNIIHVDGRIIYMNDRARKILGIEEEEVLEKDLTVFDFIVEEDLSIARKMIEDLKSGKEVPFTNLRVKRKDGEEIDIESHSIYYEYEGQNAIHIAFQDISTQKKLEKERLRASLAEEANVNLEKEIGKHKETQKQLQEAQRFTQNIIESSLDMIIATDNENRITMVNSAALEQFGYRRNEMEGLKPDTLYVYEDEHQEVLRELENTGEFSGEIENIDTEGKTFTSYLSASVLKDRYGNIVGAMGISRDITDIKAAEEELKKSEERYRDLFENATDLIQSLDREGNILFVNQAWKNALGFTQDEISNANIFDLIKPSEIEHCKEVFSQLFAGNHPKNFETVFLTHNGKELLVEGNASIRFENGVPHSTRTIFRDVTKQRKIEKAIKESEEKYRAIYDQAYIGIAMLDLKGGFVNVNRQFCEITGYLEKELRQLNFFDLTSFEKSGKKEELLKELLSSKGKGRISFEKEAMHKDGSLVNVHITVSLVKDDERNPDYFVAVLDDITDRKQAEQQLLRSLKEKEVLLKEVHHRVKNNLQVISSILNLQSSYVKDPKILDILRESQNRISSMSYIHESLYQKEDLHSVDLDEYFRNLTNNLLHSYLVDTARVSVNFDIDNFHLDLDRAIPSGLIINELVSNALKYAFSDGRDGRVEIGVKKVKKEGRSYIQITVQDNGVGLPKELDLEESDSLGLQLVSSLVEQLDAKMAVTRKNGTKYLITFEEGS